MTPAVAQSSGACTQDYIPQQLYLYLDTEPVNTTIRDADFRIRPQGPRRRRPLPPTPSSSRYATYSLSPTISPGHTLAVAVTLNFSHNIQQRL
jgi:hypothetical protein